MRVFFNEDRTFRTLLTACLALVGAGCQEEVLQESAVDRTAQAVVGCTRDTRLDPLQSGPGVTVASGQVRLVMLGQEASRNGTPVFALSSRSGLVESRWDPGAAQWSPFELVAQGATRNPSAVFIYGGLHLNTTNASGQLLDVTDAGSGWGAPTVQSSWAIDSSTASAIHAGRPRLFARGAATHALHEYGGGSSWPAVGEQQITSAPSAVSVGGRLLVFARGLDHGLMVRSEVGGVWGAWRRVTAFNHVIASAPSAVSALGRVYVYAVNPSGAVVEAYSNDLGDTWLAGSNLGGTLTSSPTAFYDGTRLFVLGRGANGASLQQRVWAGAWGDWQTTSVGTATSNTCEAAGALTVTNDSYTRASCSNAVASTELCSGGGACAVVARWPCSPWACEGSQCRTARCRSNADCAAGAQCEQGTETCVRIDYTCKDPFTVVSASGLETSCVPYKCSAGRCRGECVDGSDCSTGFCRGMKCTQS